MPLSSAFCLGGGVEILLVASRYWNQDKLWPDGPLGSYIDLTLHVPYQSQCYINQYKITETQESRVIKSLFFLPFNADNSYYLNWNLHRLSSIFLRIYTTIFFPPLCTTLYVYVHYLYITWWKKTPNQNKHKQEIQEREKYTSSDYKILLQQAVTAILDNLLIWAFHLLCLVTDLTQKTGYMHKQNQTFVHLNYMFL